MAVRPLPPHLAAVDQRARRSETPIRAWLLALAASLRAAVSDSLITEALTSGTTVPLVSALAAVAVPEPELLPQIRHEAREALRLVESREDGGRLSLRFDVHDPEFERLAREQGGRLIRDVPEQVRATVNRIVGDAYRQGLHPHRFAPQIRAIVGLTDRQAVAVANYARRLTERGASDAFVEKAAGRYADRLLKQRSVLIARTETIRAANASRIEGFRQAQRAGLLEGTAQLVWRTSHDRRVCALCDPLDGEEAPLYAPIFDGFGPPPRHPACRCHVDLA